MKFLEKLFNQSIKRYIFAVVLAVAIVLSYLICYGFKKIYNYIDACGIAMLAEIFIGALSTVSALGAFDTFGYGFSVVFGNRQNYHDLIDYSNRKKEKRNGNYFTFIPYALVAIVLLIAYIILNVIMQNNLN